MKTLVQKIVRLDKRKPPDGEPIYGSGSLTWSPPRYHRT